jgi:hypothetical protein
MRVLCLIMVLCGMQVANIEAQMSSESSTKDSYSVVLRGEAESIKVKSYDSEVGLTVYLKIELLNTGSKPVIFLEAKRPKVRGAILSKNREEIFASNRLALEYYGESVDKSPEWTVLRDELNQLSPPVDKVRVLIPNESWKWEDSVGIALPKTSDKNYFIDKREVGKTSNNCLRFG